MRTKDFRLEAREEHGQGEAGQINLDDLLGAEKLVEAAAEMAADGAIRRAAARGRGGSRGAPVRRLNVRGWTERWESG